MKKKKISILGANSFLGRNLYKFLTEIKCIEKSDISLYDIQENFIDDESNKYYLKINFLDKVDVLKIDYSCDVIYAFIGKTGTVEGFEKYEIFVNINEIVLLNILDAMKTNDCKAKFVYPSTRLVYGGDIEGALKEDATKDFKTIYAITKYAAEQYIQLYHNLFDLKFCIFRICTPWGSLLENSGNYGTFHFFIDTAISGKNIPVYGDGNVFKTYTDMWDLCNIMYNCLDNDGLKNDIFNIGGETKSLQEIATLIASRYNVKVDNVPWPKLSKLVDGGTVILDSSKLDSILGYKYKEIEFDS